MLRDRGGQPVRLDYCRGRAGLLRLRGVPAKFVRPRARTASPCTIDFMWHHRCTGVSG